MALAPIYCEKCKHRTSPSETISALGDLAVGECCAPNDVDIKLGKLYFIGYESLDFGDLLEYFKFYGIPAPKDKNSKFGWWRKDINNDNCIIIANHYNEYYSTGPISRQLVDKAQTCWVEWAYAIKRQDLNCLKQYLLQELEGK